MQIDDHSALHHSATEICRYQCGLHWAEIATVKEQKDFSYNPSKKHSPLI